MIKFVEIIDDVTAFSKFTLSDVWINEKYVVSIREARDYRTLLREGMLPPDLSESHVFSTVTTNNGHITATHVVVGAPSSVAIKLNHDKKTLLKG